MVCAAVRKFRGFRPHPISWRGSRATLFCRRRTCDDHFLLFASREGSTPLRGRRDRKTRPWRNRVPLVLARLRPQDHSARPSRPQRTSSGAARAVPKKRGGRKHLIACSPELVPALKTVLEEHTAGDPMKPDCLWTNLSMQAISRLRSAAGFHASPYTVEQLLDECKLGHRQAFKYLTMRQHKDRSQQFDILNAYKQSFLDSPNPIISIDTKKQGLRNRKKSRRRIQGNHETRIRQGSSQIQLSGDSGFSMKSGSYCFCFPLRRREQILRAPRCCRLMKESDT
jgi:Rhodopirellula transposase DDE domain